MRRMGMVVLAWALAGCATSFTGSAKVTNGPAGCKAACEGWGMELAGMVKMGEYSDGCICQVKPKAPAPGQPSPSQAPASQAPAPQSSSGATIPAVAGVHMQMVAAAAAAAHQANMAAQQRQSWRPYGSPGSRTGPR